MVPYRKHELIDLAFCNKTLGIMDK